VPGEMNSDEIAIRSGTWATRLLRFVLHIPEPKITAADAAERARIAWVGSGRDWKGPFAVDEHLRVFRVFTEGGIRDGSAQINVDCQTGAILAAWDGWGVRRL